MNRATLTAQPALDSPTLRVLTVDCEHGTTTIAYSNGAGLDAPQFTDADMVPLAVAKHYAEEGCQCTGELRRRYRIAAHSDTRGI